MSFIGTLRSMASGHEGGEASHHRHATPKAEDFHQPPPTISSQRPQNIALSCEARPK